MVGAVSAGLPPVHAAPSASAPDSRSVQTRSAPATSLPIQANPGNKKVSELSDETLNSRLAISRDNVIQRFIYKFVNPNSGKVVQQFPQKMTLDTMYAMEEAYRRFLDEHE